MGERASPRTPGSGRAAAAGDRGCWRRARVFEQAGVGFSHVFGPGLPPSATAPAAGSRRPRLRGDRRLARLPPAQSVRPHDAHERALLPRGEGGARAGLVVRRRLRPHPLLRLRGGRGPLPPHRPRGLRAVRAGDLSALQAVVRRVLLPPPPQRAARHRRPVLRRPQRVGLRPQLRLPAERRRSLPAGLPADRAAPQGRIPTASGSATSSSTAAAATSSSTWSGIAAPCSACSPAGGRSRS